MRSLFLCGILVASPSALRAQDVEFSTHSLRTHVEQVGGQKASFVAMPIPLSNPAIGTGLGVAALAIYQPRGSVRPWTTGAGGLYTDTKSWGAAAFQKAYLRGDKYRVTAGAGTGVFNVDFFGIGSDAGSDGRSIELEQKASGGVAEVLTRLRKNVHGGLRYRYIRIDSTFDTTNLLPQFQLPPIQLKSTVSQLGLSGEFDSRDSELAWRGSICRSGEGAPFYDLCNYGQSNDLRGYTAGQYRDHAMFTVQAEVRRKLFGRFGEVSNEFSKMNTKDLLPAAGIGARFEASTKYNVNLSIDYTVGDGSSALYFYVGEAF